MWRLLCRFHKAKPNDFPFAPKTFAAAIGLRKSTKPLQRAAQEQETEDIYRKTCKRSDGKWVRRHIVLKTIKTYILHFHSQNSTFYSSYLNKIYLKYVEK
jgi:hypothetical protein